MFHYKDGLFFGRNEDGSVKIRKMRDATGSAALVAEMDIDVDGWASIVAFVSVEGDTAEAWNAVKEFHAEGLLRAPLAEAPQSEKQIDRLANFILNEVPGEPSESEGAVDTAIRLIRSFVRAEVPTPVTREAFAQFVSERLSEVSMAWNPTPTGVFNPTAVAALSASIVDFILGPAKINAEPLPEKAVESPPPGAELEQPSEAPPEQPTEGEGKPPEAAR